MARRHTTWRATYSTLIFDGGTSTVSGLGGPITYGTLEALNLFAGTGSETIDISGTAAALTSVNTGDGEDTVNFADGASLSGGLLDGGAGTDLVDYSAYTTPIEVDLAETETLFLGVLSGMQEPGPLSNRKGRGAECSAERSADRDDFQRHLQRDRRFDN